MDWLKDQITIWCKKHNYSDEYRDYWLLNTHCEVKTCGIIGTAPHHIKSQGAGGPDDASNLITLCSDHHTMDGGAIHRIGWRTFAHRHPELADKIYKAMGK